MKKNDYMFYQNKVCEFFPCHEKANIETFNCFFCYCPLYVLGEECGGNFRYTDNGIKDCSYCLLPHEEKNCDYILSKMPILIKMTGKGGMKQ